MAWTAAEMVEGQYFVDVFKRAFFFVNTYPSIDYVPSARIFHTKSTISGGNRYNGIAANLCPTPRNRPMICKPCNQSSVGVASLGCLGSGGEKVRHRGLQSSVGCTAAAHEVELPKNP